MYGLSVIATVTPYDCKTINKIQVVEVNSGKSLSSKFGEKPNLCTETNDTSEESPNTPL